MESDDKNKGYVICVDKEKFKRKFFVKHNETYIAQELNIIVDNKGKVLNVIIDDDFCGQISEELIIFSRIDISEFLKKLEKGESKTLNNITHRLHYYTVEADSEEELDMIEYKLYERGCLIN